MRVALARYGDLGTRARLLLLLVPLGLVFVVITLSHRGQLSDEGAYLRNAHHLAHGFYYTRTKFTGHSSLHFGPGLPLLLVPFVLVHAPLEATRLVFGPLLVVLTAALFYETLRLFVASRSAFIGALALALYIPLYPLLPSVHSEILAAAIVVAYMYSLTRYVREGRLRFLVVSALMLAWLSVTKIVYGWIALLVLAALALLLVLQRSTAARRVFVVHLLGLIACTPWLAYTYHVSHRPFYWGSSGGGSLYWMASTNPAQLGDWHSPDDVSRTPELAPDRGEYASLRRLDDIQADSKLRHDALRLIEEHPLNYAKHVVANATRLWFSYPFTATKQKLSTVVYAIPNGILLVALLASAWVLWTVRRTLPPETGPFALLVVIGVAFQALLSTYVRMLVPLLPPMLLLLTIGSQYVRVVVSDEASRRRRRH